MGTEFNKIDLSEWKRREIFYYFSKMAPTGYSLTVNIDVTIMKNALKEKNKKFFPAFLYLITKSINKQVEFKVAYNNEELGYWNTLTPMYAAFHEDNKTFSLMWTEFNDDFDVFYNSYIENEKNYGNNHSILAQPDKLPPANCYTVSCLPWVEFEHFSLHSYENKPYFFPTIESGKIVLEKDRYIMPLSITVHHATTDGYHIKLFLEDLQNNIDNPENWLK